MLAKFRALLVGALLTIAAPALAAPPLQAYGKLPAIENVEVSGDGQAIAYIRAEGDDRLVVVQKLDGEILQRASIGRLKVRNLAWAGADHLLVVATTTAVVPNTLFWEEFPVGYSMNVKTGKVVRLLDKGSQEALNALLTAPVVRKYQGKDYAFAAGWTLEGEGRVDIWRMDLDSGYGVIHQLGSAELKSFLLSQDAEVVARTFSDRSSNWRLEVKTAGGWKEAMRRGADTIGRPSLTGFGRSADKILVGSDDRAADHWNFQEISLADGSVSERFGPKVEPEQLLSAQDGHLIGVGYTLTYPEYEFYEEPLKTLWPKVRGAFPGMLVSLSSASDDLTKIVIEVAGSGDAGSWYVIDTASMKAQRVGRARPDIAPADIADVRVVRYKAADGLAISGYLTLPPGREAKGLPLVVLPHGGPAMRDTASFDWWAQALASRGYAVFQPNFRGSGGLGGKFETAGYGEWGRKMQTDISDGVDALAKTGMIDPARVCIAGASYGGYAALAGAALQPGLYRCAVAVAGVSDLPQMLDWVGVNRTGSTDPAVRYWRRFMGVQASNDPVLASLSPARQAAAVKAPVLLIHGRDDTVVAYEQSTTMERALKAAGKPVTLVTLKDEDHWLSREETRVQMLQSMVAFLEKENPPT